MLPVPGRLLFPRGGTYPHINHPKGNPMKKTFLRIALLSLSWGFLFTACTKDDQPVQPQEPQTEEIAVSDNTTGLSESDEVVAIVEDALNRGGAAMRVSAEQETYQSAYGAVITVQKNGDGTGNITIDFGAGTTGRDGRTRKGNIFIAYSGSYRAHNSRQVITFGNYYVNDHRVEGQKTLLTTIDNSNGSYPVFVTNIKVESGKITWKDGKTTEWSGDRIRKYDYKNTLADPNDDLVTITGTAVGKSRNGIGFTAATTAPLVIKMSCAVSQQSWLPLEGVLEVTPEAGAKRTVNYGSGTCDQTFTVSANGRSWDITLRQ
jgi:hypothetical protein